jgi:hypothetical protein
MTVKNKMAHCIKHPFEMMTVLMTITIAMLQLLAANEEDDIP